MGGRRLDSAVKRGVGTGADDGVQILSGIRDVCHVVQLTGGKAAVQRSSLSNVLAVLRGSRPKPFWEKLAATLQACGTLKVHISHRNM